MNTIAVVSFSDISSDSRVLKQIKSLSQRYRVVSIGFGPTPLHSFAHLNIQKNQSFFRLQYFRLLFVFRNYRLFSFHFYNFLDCLHFFKIHKASLFLLNDCSSWPLIHYLDARVVLIDAHEFSPDELSDNFKWRLLIKPYKLWCSYFASKAAACFSVEENICNLWQSFSGVDFSLLPNSSLHYPSPLPLSTRYLSKNPTFVHHGVAHPSRKIELMLQAFVHASSTISSDFYLTGGNSYYLSELSSIADSIPNCRICNPVLHDQLHLTLSNYMYSLISIYPSNLNYQYCLPNKLFQCIQARLPIVCGPTPSIANIVQSFGIGVVARDFSPLSLGNAIDRVLALSYDDLLINLENAAATLCWDHDQNILISSVNELSSTPL